MKTKLLRKKVTLGAIVFTTLGDGSFVYGQCCGPHNIAFFNYRSKVLPSGLDVVAQSAIAFRVSVTFHGNRHYEWRIIGDAPLAPPCLLPMRFARIPVGSSQIFLDQYPERSVPIDGSTARTLEVNAVWSLSSLERRLELYFSGDTRAKTVTVFDDLLTYVT